MKKGRRGSVLIEGALVLAVLLAVACGLVEAGRYLLAWNFVSFAAREATRYAEVHGASSRRPATPQDVERFVIGRAIGVDPSLIRVKTEWLPDSNPGSKVRVEVRVGDLAGTSESTVLN